MNHFQLLLVWSGIVAQVKGATMENFLTTNLRILLQFVENKFVYFSHLLGRENRIAYNAPPLPSFIHTYVYSQQRIVSCEWNASLWMSNFIWKEHSTFKSRIFWDFIFQLKFHFKHLSAMSPLFAWLHRYIQASQNLS